MLGIKPKIKENPNALIYRYCSICGTLISDEDCAETDSNLCKVCGGEVCAYNERHKVKKIGNLFFCTRCNRYVKATKYYRRWIDSNIKIEAAQIIDV